MTCLDILALSQSDAYNCGTIRCAVTLSHSPNGRTEAIPWRERDRNVTCEANAAHLITRIFDKAGITFPAIAKHYLAIVAVGRSQPGDRQDPSNEYF